MPAYFDLTLTFCRETLGPGLVEEVEAALERAGVTFLSGYREDAAWPRREIAAWNQRKLEEGRPGVLLWDTAMLPPERKKESN